MSDLVGNPENRSHNEANIYHLGSKLKHADETSQNTLARQCMYRSQSLKVFFFLLNELILHCIVFKNSNNARIDWCIFKYIFVQFGQ